MSVTGAGIHADSNLNSNRREYDQKNTNARTTTLRRLGAFFGAVGSTAALWNDQRDIDPSVTES